MEYRAESHYHGIEFRQLSCSDRLLDRQKVSHFGEFVDDNEYSIIATLGLWKPSHEVLGNVVISKKILRTRKIMVMHSNERGECCPRTVVDRKRKR